MEEECDEEQRATSVKSELGNIFPGEAGDVSVTLKSLAAGLGLCLACSAGSSFAIAG